MHLCFHALTHSTTTLQSRPNQRCSAHVRRIMIWSSEQIRIYDKKLMVPKKYCSDVQNNRNFAFFPGNHTKIEVAINVLEISQNQSIRKIKNSLKSTKIAKSSSFVFTIPFYKNSYLKLSNKHIARVERPSYFSKHTKLFLLLRYRGRVHTT